MAQVDTGGVFLNGGTILGMNTTVDNISFPPPIADHNAPRLRHGQVLQADQTAFVYSMKCCLNSRLVYCDFFASSNRARFFNARFLVSFCNPWL